VLTLNSDGSKSKVSATSKPIGDGDYDYTEAVDHIGEKATVTGTVQSVFTSKSGTVFFDFCENFQTCTFSAVIFASDVPKFKDLMQYEREVKLTGIIKSYEGKAEIILNGPEQIK
jgi:DNA/RNA endonuclease YhcR with UshA esterase domain